MTTTTGIGSSIRTTLVVVSLGVGVLASLATVVAFLGSTWWGFDLLANFRWQFAWVAFMAAVVYSLTTQGVAALVFLAAVVVNGFVIAPAWTGSQPTGTGEDGIRVVSVDMSDTIDSDGEILRWLFDSEADLIIVSGIAGGRLMPLVAEGSPYDLIVEADPNSPGITIVGRQPYAFEEVPTDASGSESLIIVSVPSGGAVTSVVAGWGEIASDAARSDALASRLAAIGALVDTRTGPMMVVGNLGATRYTHGMRSLLGSTGLRDATEGSGYLSTWPVSGLPVIGGWIGIPIDTVLMTRELTPFSLETGPAIGTNHLPVTVVVGAVADS